MISPEEARKAYEKYGSIRKACKKLGVPRTTFRRALNKALANEERTQVQQKSKKPSPLVSSNKNRKITNLVLPDVHSPYEDSEVLTLAIEYAKMNYSVNKVTLLGDFLDCFQISRFSKNPRERMSFADELKYGSELLDQIMDIFSGCQFTFIKGNHERRFEKYLLENAPELIGMSGTTIPEQLNLKDKGIEYVDNMKLLEDHQKPYCIGELHYLHGDELPGAGVNPARNKFLKVNHNILFGHHHRVETYTHKCFEQVKGSFSCGCLCSTSPEYMPLNGHIAGFAVVEHEEDGTFSVQNKMVINGKIH